MNNKVEREQPLGGPTYIQQCDLWMVFSTHEQAEVPCAIQKLKGGRMPAASKAVQGQVSLNHTEDNTAMWSHTLNMTELSNNSRTCHGPVFAGTHIVLYGLWMVDTLYSLTTHHSLFLVAEGLWDTEKLNLWKLTNCCGWWFRSLEPR